MKWYFELLTFLAIMFGFFIFTGNGDSALLLFVLLTYMRFSGNKKEVKYPQ